LKENIKKIFVGITSMLLLSSFVILMFISNVYAEASGVDIKLTITASKTKVLTGTPVSYLYNATNTGEVPLTGNITDATFGVVGSFVNLQPGGWVGYNITHVITQNTSNVATAYGFDQYKNLATDTDSAFVQVYIPTADISLTKIPSANKVVPGTAVSYLYNATNTGETALTGAIYDDQFGPVGSFVNLQPGGWVGFNVTHVINQNTTNTAIAYGLDSYGSNVTDTATAFVQVYIPTTCPVITVTTPNGGEKWVQGSTNTIKWSCDGRVGRYVKIELLKDGVVERIIASKTANDGYYRWRIPSNLRPGENYKIRITSTYREVTDSSDSNFAITSGADRTLTLTSPNECERWERGTVHTITWSKSGRTGAYVKIELLKDGVVYRVIASKTANDGYYRWRIPSRLRPGENYKIRITSTAYRWITDASKINFVIAT
jgi:hypothetical protein